MKLLQINAVYKISSTGRTCYEIQEYLNKKTDIECRTAFCYGGEKNDGYVIGNKLDRKVHALMSRLSGEQGHFSTLSTIKLIRYIDSYNPDIIHLRNLHGNYVNYPMLFKHIAKKQIPVVITLHDCWFFTGKCMHYTQLNCNRWQNNCGNCPALMNGNRSWLFDRTQAMLNEKKTLLKDFHKLAIVGVSDWVTGEIAKSDVGTNADVLTRIYNWIDTDVFKPGDGKEIRKKYNLTEDFIILGVSSKWVMQKGTEDFISLSQNLSDGQGIALVGEKPDGIELPENIHCLGSVNDVNELADLYRAADVFVTFSKEETFGKVSAESLACGTPVICYDSTANPELIGENCGYKVAVGNVSEVLDDIKKVARNGKAFYSDACVQYACDNFQKDNCIKQYLDLYIRISGAQDDE